MWMVAGLLGAGLLAVIFASCGAPLSSTGERCGDTTANVRYRECASSADDATCRERGGAWGDRNAKLRGQSCGPSGKCKMTEGLPLEMSCGCAVPDLGCPCGAASDCVAACYGSKNGDDCPSTARGSCGGLHTFGCRCLMTEAGASNVCI
jgi:hypothetical protein